MRICTSGKNVYSNLNIFKFVGLYLTIIIILLTFLSMTFAVENKYIGSKESNNYHEVNCKWVKKIKKENIIEFKTIKEAEDAGYKPC
jgi:hypothetical protein